MKKTLLLAAIVCMAGHVVHAQELIISNTSDGEVSGTIVIAKSLSSSQKPILSTREYDHNNGKYQINFYNPDLSVSKTLNITMPSYRYVSYDEVAVVEPTGSHVKIFDQFTSENAFYDADISSVTSSDELIAAIKAAYIEYNNGVYVFLPYTDPDGRIGCILINPYGSSSDNLSDEYNSTFFEYPTYGTKYPNSYYAIVDGSIKMCDIEYDIVYEYPIPSTTDQYGSIHYSPNADELTWQRETNKSGLDEIRYPYLNGIYYYDYDNTEGVGENAYFTQTLFNNDSQWEYFVPILEEYSEYGEPEEYSYRDENGEYDYDNLHFTRSYKYSARIVGYKVVSENGSTVMTIRARHANSEIRLDRIMTLGGKKYFTTGEYYYDDEGMYRYVSTLYVYDTYTTSVQEVASVKGRAPMAAVTNGSIDVTLDESDTDSDLILSNMAGQVVGRKHVGAGETKSRMNAANMPRGLYNLTLRRNGRVLNNQKMMVK